MPPRTGGRKQVPKPAKAKSRTAQKDLDAKRKSGEVKGGIVAVLIGTSSK